MSENERVNERGVVREMEMENIKIYLLRVERYFDYPTFIKQMTTTGRWFLPQLK